MAIVMAQADQKIIILDCDMRKPRIHKLFECENEKGMSNVLVGEDDWRDVRIKTSIENLDLIPTGPHPPNPAELVGSDRMKTVIDEMLTESEYNLVLIDSPPIAAVTDPVVLSHIIEGVILVIQPGLSRRGLIANAIRLLHDAQAHVLGVVLNNVRAEKDGYYYSRYGYYYYSSYEYGEDGTKKQKKRKKRGSRSA